MQRGAHLILLFALLPGVILPAQFLLCLGGPSAAGGAGCCAEHHATAARRSCCTSSSCREHSGAIRTIISEKSACRCCVVLKSAKPVTPRPEAPVDAPDLAEAPSSAQLMPAAAPPVTVVSTNVHAGLSPPGSWRTLPLVI